MCSSLPLLETFLGSHGTTPKPSLPSAKSSSDGSLFRRLAGAAGKPKIALEKLIEDFQILSDPDTERKAILNLQLRSCKTLQEWRVAAIELDDLEANNDWKRELESPEYNYALVQARLQSLDDARTSQDAARMLFLIRTALSRHLGGMSNMRLYKHSHVGTKVLIERYIASALETLDALLEITKPHYGSGLDSRMVLDQILQARQSFGRSALLLSGGGTFGMSHVGVVKCLWEQQLLPRIISGASAGSIVCAVLAVKTDDEVPGTLDEFCYGELNVFRSTDGSDSALRQATRFLKTGALFDIANLTRVMRNLVGDLTFQEAYNRTRRILNITVSSASVFELPRLLNYVTAPNVLIWSAVAASCSVPVIFSSATLLAKDPRTGKTAPWNPSPQRWIDGSVDNDIPMTRLAEMFNVNHFIVSQVNPHVVPFLEQEEYEIAKEARAHESGYDSGPGWLGLFAGLAKEEAMHRMHVLSEMGILTNLLSKTRSILSQKYSGDITILPEVSFAQLPKVLMNPTTDFMLQAMLHGEKATWPKLSRIQNHCAIELALDDAVQHLRARIAFSPSQVDLRLNRMTGLASRAASEGRSLKDRRTQSKRLRFSGEEDERVARTRSSRPKSIHEGYMTLPAPGIAHDSPKRTQRKGSPLHIDLKPKSSPPIFLTGSEADSDADSESTSDPPSPSEELSSSVDLYNLFGLRPTSDQLFPSASQPATPSQHSRLFSYFGSAATPTQAASPQTPANTTTLHMTSSTAKQSSPSLQDADRRRTKFAGSTPRNVSPARSPSPSNGPPEADIVSSHSTASLAQQSTNDPPPPYEPRHISPNDGSSGLDADVSATRSKHRRKRNSKGRSRKDFDLDLTPAPHEPESEIPHTPPPN